MEFSYIGEIKTKTLDVWMTDHEDTWMWVPRETRNLDPPWAVAPGSSEPPNKDAGKWNQAFGRAANTLSSWGISQVFT